MLVSLITEGAPAASRFFAGKLRLVTKELSKSQKFLRSPYNNRGLLLCLTNHVTMIPFKVSKRLTPPSCQPRHKYTKDDGRVLNRRDGIVSQMSVY